jgi:hypothetical protein
MPRGNPSPKLAITVAPEIHARVLAAAEEEEDLAARADHLPRSPAIFRVW